MLNTQHVHSHSNSATLRTPGAPNRKDRPAAAAHVMKSSWGKHTPLLQRLAGVCRRACRGRGRRTALQTEQTLDVEQTTQLGSKSKHAAAAAFACASRRMLVQCQQELSMNHQMSLPNSHHHEQSAVAMLFMIRAIQAGPCIVPRRTVMQHPSYVVLHVLHAERRTGHRERASHPAKQTAAKAHAYPLLSLLHHCSGLARGARRGDVLHERGQVGDLLRDVGDQRVQHGAGREAGRLAKLVGRRLPADGADAVALRRDREWRVARHALALLVVAARAVLELEEALVLRGAAARGQGSLGRLCCTNAML